MSDVFRSTLNRAWDAYDAYLFDIDGTLLVSDDAVHYLAFCHALEILSERSMNLDGVTTHGNTDIGILRDALALGGFHEERWRQNLDQACAAMGSFVLAHKEELRVRLLPEVYNILNHLQQRGAILGVATGNLKIIGRLKLASAGILDFFTAGSYSDRYEHRKDVFRHALLSVREQIGSKGRVCFIGDTPEDVRAAKCNGEDMIAVATGVYTFEELLAEHPNKCCKSLTELLANVSVLPISISDL